MKVIKFIIFFHILGIAIIFSGTSYADLNDGLVAYYPFNGNANDESGNGNHGTVFGASLTSDRCGIADSAYSFVESYIVVPDSTSLDLSIGLTIAAWIKSNDTSDPRVIVSKWDDNSGDWSYIFKDHNYSDKLRIEISKGGFKGDLADLEGSSSIPMGAWTHVAITYDSENVKLYFNGEPDADTAATGVIKNSAAELLIGATGSSSVPTSISEYFDGIIDDIRIYNRALSDVEIRELAEGCPCFPCEGDFDRDGDVDGSDLALFAADFGRTDCPVQYVFGLDTHAMGVQATGQSICYDADGTVIDCADTGQDGDLQKGMLSCSLRFTDNGDGTVTDNLTGLVWLKNAECDGTKRWSDALTYCNNLADGSFGLTDGSVPGDWRLPNVKEMGSLIDLGNYNPALPSGHPFTSVQRAFYWSATTYTGNTPTAWYFHMGNGYYYPAYKSSYYYVWPVRGGN